MLSLKLLLTASFVLIPSFAFAWGPLTHVYLGSEILSLGSLIPAGIYTLIRKYRHDFIYGNLMADLIIGKKFIPEGKNPHSWDMALNLLDSAETKQQEAFAYGYMSHLAADTIAHGSFMDNRRDIGHTLVELRADSIIDRKYWYLALDIDRSVQKRNDLFLENSLERALFSFKTNKKIFKGLLLLSGFNQERVGDIIQKKALRSGIPSRKKIEKLHDESLDRILDVLRNGTGSHVINESPMVRFRKAS